MAEAKWEFYKASVKIASNALLSMASESKLGWLVATQNPQPKALQNY